MSCSTFAFTSVLILGSVGVTEGRLSGNSHVSDTTCLKAALCVKGASEDDLLDQVDIKLPGRAARLPLLEFSRPAFGQGRVIVQRPTVPDDGAPLPLRTRRVAASCRL